MGKVSPPSIKYIIYANFSADGVVEKPDVIGAIFGQTEGLLGEEMELRELQKKGKIGRIDVTLNVVDSKTTGIVEIPTSIDKTETAIIAAAIETIDRIGPCEAKFEIKSIEDVRSAKRQYIVERAKKLIEKISENTPELKLIQQDIINHARISKIREFGKELLPAGPDIENAKELIVVEGRADVIALLKAGIKNVIAMNGTSMPQTIKDLGKEKQLILFIDGDRGGLLIAKDALATTKIRAIARAPDGKEVEELTEKEIFNCLRNKISVEEFKEKYLKRTKSKREENVDKKIELVKKITDEIIEKNLDNLQRLFYEIEGTKTALIVGLDNQNELKILRKTQLSEVVRVLAKTMNPVGLIIDGNATSNIIKMAEKKKCKFIVAKNFAATSDLLRLMSF